MKGTVHIFDLLEKSANQLPRGLCAVFGNDRFLKRLAINQLKTQFAGEDADFAITSFEGSEATWADVNDELSSRSLFGGDGPKLVVIDDADVFSKDHRDRLESVVDSDGDTLLVIVVGTWTSNMRLYKILKERGLQIQCSEPKQGRSKKRNDKAIQNWLVTRAKNEYEFQLPAGGAQTIIDLTDANFGRMDQELQKLVLYADADGKVDDATIKTAVGGWRTQTMWEAIDAAIAGDAGQALTLLDQLIRGGEYPLALFGQIAWSLRRYGQATEVVFQQLRAGQRPRLGQAAQEAGFHTWGNELETAQRNLKTIGSQRAGQILDWLREADLALKRSHSREDRSRLVLEKLLVRLSSELSTS